MEYEQPSTSIPVIADRLTGTEGTIATFNDFLEAHLKEEAKFGKTRSTFSRPSISNVRPVNSVDYGEPFSATRSIEDGLPVYELTLQNDDATEGFALVVEDADRQDVFAYSPVGSIADTTYNKGLAIWFRDLYAFGKIVASEAKTRNIWQEGWEYGSFSPISDWEFDRVWTEADSNKPELYWGPLDWSEDIYLWRSSLLYHEWDQTAPYNNKVPSFLNSDPTTRVRVGCWATAVGMIMAIYKRPSTYNWDLIHSSVNILPSETRRADEVSRLLLDVANAGKTKWDPYKNSGTTQPSNIESGLRRLGYDSELVFYGSQMISMDIIEELRNNRPVLCVGYGSDGGHIWVVDRVKIRQLWRYQLVYTLDDSAGTKTWHYNKIRCQSNMLRCNWGWGGPSNGWYYKFEPYVPKLGYYTSLSGNKYLVKGIKPL